RHGPECRRAVRTTTERDLLPRTGEDGDLARSDDLAIARHRHRVVADWKRAEVVPAGRIHGRAATEAAVVGDHDRGAFAAGNRAVDVATGALGLDRAGEAEPESDGQCAALDALCKVL